jgi:inner membrane protein
LPDLDSYNSKIGRRFSSRVITAFTRHRGIMHSLIFLFAAYFVLYLYVPSVSLGFLVGYSVHLFGDLLTRKGLRLFYPFGLRIRGFVKTGGRIESFIFLSFEVMDLLLIVKITFFHLLFY